MSVVVVTDRTDPSAHLLAEAASRRGHDALVVDLRRDRLGLRPGERPGVLLEGRSIRPELVVNRTSVSTIGPPAADVLGRQRASTWSGRYVAAREEQGLVLAALDRWALEGARVVNPARTTDLRVMEAFVRDRLVRRGVRLASPPSTPDTRVMVLGGRVVLGPGQERPPDDALRMCRLIAEAAEVDLCEVHFEVHSDEWKPTGWDAAPEFPTDARIGATVAYTVITHLLGSANEPPARPVRPTVATFLPDLEENLLRSLDPRRRC